MKSLALFLIAAFALGGCRSTPILPENPGGAIREADPTPGIGLARDPNSGEVYYALCATCGKPTPKTRHSALPAPRSSAPAPARRETPPPEAPGPAPAVPEAKAASSAPAAEPAVPARPPETTKASVPLPANTSVVTTLPADPVKTARPLDGQGAATSAPAAPEPDSGPSTVAAEAAPAKVVWRLVGGLPIHTQLEAWAKSAGWSFAWKSRRSWLVPADTEFVNVAFDAAVEEVVRTLYQQGKPVRLELWEKNRVAEVVDVPV